MISHFIAVLRLDLPLKGDQSFAAVGALLKLDIVRGDKDLFSSGDHHCSIVEFAVVKIDDKFFLGLVDRAREGFECEGDFQLVTALEHYFCVYDMEDVSGVLASGRVVVPFYFIEGGVAPGCLAAGGQLTVSACNLEMGILHSCLANVMMIKFHKSLFIQV